MLAESRAANLSLRQGVPISKWASTGFTGSATESESYAMRVTRHGPKKPRTPLAYQIQPSFGRPSRGVCIGIAAS
ncbi:hypothetical protein CGGC5_v003664 [Colletotrichum fructicola Nara gc5]|uniref:Uncharacterized protein n=1 Tax=Colletotrichum fructicola (strain Nara gc5) TaxID=1213859 RepID=A0A7J6JH28_COLFN|nr:hypothetical protein CGGC5_v003664 [Colletotrichum fructicola Nara gc5]